MPAHISATIINLALIFLTAWVFWITHSPWSFVLLLFMFRVRYYPPDSDEDSE
jgi:hypothetical protein